jgi:hypothetical protein
MREKAIIETANGQIPIPASRPACAGSRPNSSAHVGSRNMRVMNPNAVVIRAMKQPQNSILLCPSSSSAAD